tara:strand:- start:477 stop:1013 length:537 start_codon:yes stop_codon:yes gene_type:complete
LVNIARILKRLKIPYMVTGGMAVFVWGRPRFTADIDIVIEFKLEQIDILNKSLIAFSKEGYVDEYAMREAILDCGEFNFIDGQTGIKVDFWVLKKGSFDSIRLKRKIAKKILGKTVYFTSPEDLILSKLEWYKLSESTRHLEDIESVLKISGKKLDMRYLKQWAIKLGVKRVLDKLLK